MGGLTELKQAVGLEGASSVTFDTNSGLRYAVLTGRATFQIVGLGPDWTPFPIQLGLPIPELPAGKGIDVISVAPVVSLAAISNDETAVNAGWKVGAARGDARGTVIREVNLRFSVSARGKGSHVTAVAYTVHLLGSLATYVRVQGEG